MREIVRFLESSASCLAFCRIPSDAQASTDLLLSAGFTCIEELVTLECDLSGETLVKLSNPAITIATSTDLAAITAIATQAFRHDRYHADIKIPGAIADSIKAAWARNNAAGRADATFLFRRQDEVCGFNTCLLRDKTALIDLIAVAPAHQASGVGSALVTAAQDHYVKRCNSLQVGTQSSNHGSLRLYEKHGFRRIRIDRTFHWHPSAMKATT
ncbi:MAG: GNAT family N-acetyltransferase [Ferrovibrio sp.]|uniref:GNAT family N-acetyltransferase n=1 Tax=Ferrovibrio sp. TaxID=1917215 RepID=UPI00261C3691|nr:GNAT family N-acetyltransferase [Ferrovibrio sp.]MCW0234934.1 GNAT family N-acetyltransferase [Ferrovibrio sp.]